MSIAYITHTVHHIFEIMASPAGLEPAAIRLEGERSIRLSYGDVLQSLVRRMYIR